MPDPYTPDLADFCDILRDYSRLGLSYFKNLPSSIQLSARAKLAGALEDKESDIQRKFASIKKGGRSELKFLPMPQPGGRNFKVSFFLPRISTKDAGGYECSFVIVFWIERDGGKTIAVRLEPPMSIADGDENVDAHRFSHLQLTRVVLSPKITTDLGDWVPDSYPAFPMVFHHPIQYFVGMAAAVHGYSGSTKKEYVRAAISDAMATGNAALLARKLLEEVKRMLD